MVLFRLAELSIQNPSCFVLLSLFPSSEHRKVLACAPSHCMGTAQHSKMCRKLQARSSLWRRLVMCGRIMPYSLVTVQIPSRSAGAPTRVKRKLLCSRGSPHQQHSLARAILVSCHEADLLFFPSQSLCRDGYISGNILFLPGEHLLSSPSHAALSGLFIGQRQGGNVAHLNELNALQPMQMRDETNLASKQKLVILLQFQLTG